MFSIDPWSPCDFAAGSAQKILVLQLRVAYGAPLWHLGDNARILGQSRVVVESISTKRICSKFGRRLLRSRR
jgi:hypothetical protein